jgi:hypothetical protein
MEILTFLINIFLHRTNTNKINFIIVIYLLLFVIVRCQLESIRKLGFFDS